MDVSGSIMRIIARFEKGEAARYVSHLDIQRLFQRAFRRARIPLAYSQGFNPHPLLAFASALPVGYTGAGEWLDVKLEGTAAEMPPERFMQAVNETLPAGFAILAAEQAEERMPALSALMCAASYRLLAPDAPDGVQAAIDALMLDPIMVEKRTKGGMRTVSMRPQLLSMTYRDGVFRIVGTLNAHGSLHVELLMGALMRGMLPFSYQAHREMIYFMEDTVPALPKMPEHILEGAAINDA